MQKILVMAVTVLLVMPVHAALYELKEEYRQDVINYDDDLQQFWRQSLSVKLGSSSAVLSHRYTPDNGKNVFAGYLDLQNQSGKLRFSAGNYNINFGTGLFLGARRYMSDDPFAAARFPDSRRFLVPVSSSPVYCFSGLAGVYSSQQEGEGLMAGTFLSYRKRYTRWDYYDERRIPSSLASVLSRTEPEGLYTCPVGIRDCGASLGYAFRNGFYAGILCYYEDMTACNDSPVTWEYDEGYFSSTGIRRNGGAGISLRYEDDRTLLYAEGGLTLRQKYDRGKEAGWGLSCGGKFSFSRAAFNLFMTETGPGWYAPEGAESLVPRDEYGSSLTIRPADNIDFGGTVSFVRKKYPSLNEAAPASSVKEGVFVSMAGDKWRIRGSFDTVNRTAASGQSRLCREALVWRFSPWKKNTFSARASVQQKTGRCTSWSAGGEYSALFSAVRFGLSTSFYSINGSGIYSTVLPSSGSIASSSFIGKTAVLSVISLEIKYGEFLLKTRYEQQYSAAGTGESRCEISGKAVY